MVVGTLLLIGVYAIPEHLIHDKVSSSLEMLIDQDRYPYIIPGYEPSKLDNFSEFIMLEMAVFTHYDSVVENAMLNPYHESNEPMNALRACLNGDDLQVDSYSRYWHGYLVYLKPLLTVFSVGTIRLLIGSFQLFLTFLIAIQLSRHQALIPFLVLLVSICFPTVFISLQYTSCSMIALVTSYAVLKSHPDGMDLHIGFLMLAAGMATAFFDFLTFPLLTLMMPLSMWLLVNHEHFSVKILLLSIIAWGLGYVGMWTGKWLVASLLTHQNLLNDVTLQLKLRTSATDVYGTDIPVTSALFNCTRLVFTPVVLFFFSICVVYSLINSIRQKTIFLHTNTRLALLTIVFIPVIWMIITCNHSLVHKAYTYRTLSSAVFPLLLAFSPLNNVPWKMSQHS